MKVIETKSGWLIKCQGCRQHCIPKRWKFNGDFEKPTFSPSINESWNQPEMKHYNPECKSGRCHYSITDGKITFHTDCTHKFAGQTFDLEDFDQVVLDYYKSAVD